jgi:uncharacterized protein YceH (UPF0502 family)
VIALNEYELRVLGALVEKQIATPDYYPMTLNALTNACNQKNHRDPVTGFDDQTVTRALDSLREKNLAYVFHGSDARVPKYGHTFIKRFDLTAQETAVLTVLLLRGPQTPGELRSRTPHLFNFENLPEVETTLLSLGSRDEPLVVKLPRGTGTKEARFAHLLGGAINLEEFAAAAEAAPARGSGGRGDHERLAKLESEVEELRQALAALQTQFAEFKKQFD